MVDVPDARLRSEIQALLVGVDLGATSIGKLRSQLEKRLGLAEGALEPKKEHVNQVLKEELTKKVQGGDTPDDRKRKAGKAEQEPPSKKEKKDKDKKGKKDKKKKDKKAESSEEAAEVEAQAPEEPAPPEEPPPPEELAPAAEEQAPAPAEEPAPAEAPEAGETQAEETKAAAEEEPTMGMSTFEDFDPGAEKDTADADEAELAVPEPDAPRLQACALSGAEDGKLRLWDLENYTCVRVLEGHTKTVRTIAVDWDEMQALSGADDGAKFWNLRRGTCSKSLAEADSGCNALVPDWKELRALGGCGDGKLRLWGLNGGEVDKSTFAHHGGVWALEVNWFKALAVSGGDEHFAVWDLGDLSCKHRVGGHLGGIMSLSVDWDEQRLVVGTGERGTNNLRLWDLETLKPLSNLPGHQGFVAHINADWSNSLACTGAWDGFIRLWNMDKGMCTQRHECRFGRIRALDVNFEEMRVACGASSGKLHIVDLQTGASVRALEGHVGGVTAVQARF